LKFFSKEPKKEEKKFFLLDWGKNFGLALFLGGELNDFVAIKS